MRYREKRKRLVGLLRKALAAGLLLSLVTPGIAYATFVMPAAIAINGTFADWGTTGSPASGVYLFRDASNSGEQDGSGFSGKESDLDYFWAAISTQSGGTALANPANPLQYFYYRIDTREDDHIHGQSYYLQLNLGAASPGYADHLLQIWADHHDTPEVTLVLKQYQTPYPQMRAFTTGSLVGRVSNVAHPYPGFGGAVDTGATGAIGEYDGEHCGIEVRIPAAWYSATYGGAVKNDGTGAPTVTGVLFTGTGHIGAVGTVKDTLNDAGGTTRLALTSTVTGETLFVTCAISQLVFTTAPQTIAAGAASAIMAVQARDATGAPQNVAFNTTISLTSTSANGRFDTSPSGPFNGTITSVTIPAGSNSASFYYKDTNAGTPTITAAESPSQGWTDATQQETVTSVIVLPTVATGDATLVEGTTATLNGTLTSDGGEPGQYRFQYGSVSGGPYPYSTGWTGSITTGQTFSTGITGLAKGTKYYFVAQAKNSAGVATGSQRDLLTRPDPPIAFSAVAFSTSQVDLTWSKGSGAQRTMVRRKTGGYPTGVTDGVQVYFGTGSGVTDRGLAPGTTYYYAAWSEVTGSQQWSGAYAAVTVTTSGTASVTVGGEVFPADKLSVLMPWLILATLLSLALGGSTLVSRGREL